MSTPHPSPLPLVVQLGFAGSRHLLDRKVHPEVDPASFLAEVEEHLTGRLQKLHDEHLQPHHFFCGISQIAIGADMLFTRACARLGVSQRILLPEDRDEYLNGVGSNGTPDFTAEEKAEALRLTASPHVIHERVVSDAPDRRARFEDVNLEIVRVSDVLICLLRAEAEDKPGGTHDLIDRASTWHRPVLIITVGVKDGRPAFGEHWRAAGVAGSPTVISKPFLLPSLPPALAEVSFPATVPPATLPDPVDYFRTLKGFSSDLARRRRQIFKRAALVIIGTHVIATICAVIARELKGQEVWRGFLGTELLLLSAGFCIHQWLHRSRAAHVWAVSRLVAELTRSVLEVGRLHVYLDHLFGLPFPAHLRPLLRTINVLHLRSTRPTMGSPWEPARTAYAENRVAGQVGFYQRESATSGRQLRRARHTFFTCSSTAILVTVVKLTAPPEWLPLAHGLTAWDILGALTVILPVLAVAALSLAAAFDLEARHATFTETLQYLTLQKDRLNDARSEREFARLVLETESRLLGETVNWFSRRSYTGVA